LGYIFSSLLGLVTGACFWYLSRRIDFSQVLSAIALLEFRWAASTLILVLELPLSGLRWRNVVHALGVTTWKNYRNSNN